MRSTSSAFFWSSLSLFLVLLTGSVLQAQVSLYTEDFELETPQDPNDLCLPDGVGYVPADNNWALGPACAIPQNGVPKLVDVSGDQYLEFNQQYPADSEVWNSATIDVSELDDVIVSFDARSVGGHENSGNFVDSLDVILVLDGTELGESLVHFVGHVDGFGNGSNTTRDSSFSTSVDVTGVDSLSLRIRVRISGADGSESYQLDDIAVCADVNGDGICSACDEEVTFTAGGTAVSLDDYTIQCAADLPDSCLAGVIPSRGVITGCVNNEERLAVTACSATTAIGDGPDGAIVLMDIDGNPHDDRYFIPTGDGLTFTQYGNGTSRVSGQVADMNDATAILNVDINYDSGVPGSEWGGGFKSVGDFNDTSMTNDWMVYMLSSGASWLTGAEEGSLAGTTLRLEHAPSSEYFGFQVGEGANDRNLNYGAGGWFSYDGQLNGQDIQGAQGDLFVDLSCGTPQGRSGCPTEEDVTNGTGQQVTLRYAWIDDSCTPWEQRIYEQVITALDTIDPVLSGLPADSVLVYCEESIPDTAEVTATDNCELDTLTFFETPPFAQSCAGTYQIMRQWTATDCTGNMEEFTQMIYVVDTIAPAITGGADTTVQCNGTGNTEALSAWLNNHAGASASDGCGTSTWLPSTMQDVNAGCGNTGSTTYMFTAEDDCGNTSSVEFTFTIIDTVAPSLTAAMDTTTECNSGNAGELQAWLDNHGGATANDECSGVTWSHSDATLSDDCGNTGSTTVWFTATDGCGNADSTQATFTIEDTTNPIITLMAADSTVECDGLGNTEAFNAWLNSYGGAAASDDCSSVTWSDNYTASPDSCGATTEVTVTFTATDECTNSSTTTATFKIIDTTAPSITVMAADTTVECDGQGNTAELQAWLDNQGGASANDDCSGPVSWTNDYAGLSDECGATGSTMVTFTAADSCGNTSTTTATFTIEDTTNPDADITCPSDTTVYVDAACNVDVTPLALGVALTSSADICSAVTDTLYHTDMDSTSSCLGSYSFTRMWTYVATDGCGNDSTVTCEQSITVLDTIAPTWNSFIPYEQISCELMTDPTDPTSQPITAVDNCSGVRYEIDSVFMSGGCPGTWIRTWTAIDSCGNVSEPAQQYIQLFDNTPPTIDLTCPEDFLVEVDGDCNAVTDTAAAGVPTVVVTDNCDAMPSFEVTYSDGDTTGICTGSYSFTRTWRVIAEDHCERTDTVTCEQLITVADSLAPVFDVMPMDTTVECNGAGNTADFQNWINNNAGGAASDNCGGIVTWSADDYDLVAQCGSTGKDTVTFTITDPCGNTSTASAVFTIVDTTPPSITALSPFVIDCGQWACDIDSLVNAGAVSATDVCGTATLAVFECTQQSVGCLPVGGFEVIYVATDACGNTDTTSQVVVLRDTVSPVITTMAMDTVTECNSGNADQLQAWLDNHGGAEATDNCGTLEWTNDFTALNDSCGATGAVTVTFTVKDNCDNASHTTATFQIIDTTAPSITVMAADTTVECDGQGNTAELQAWLDNQGGASANDDCSGPVSWTNDHAGLSDECGATGSTTVTFTAADSCGNTSTTTATFFIEDTTAPSIETAAQDTTTECDGAGNNQEFFAWLANQGGAVANDDCGNVTWYNNFDCAVQDGDFLTYNQGNLGSSSSVAGSDYLEANFASVFPSGVSTGCDGGYKLTFTTVDAVDTYLPCTGSAQDLVLTHGGTNPTQDAIDPTCWDNAFVSHLLTAKINVGFDAASAAYSSSDFPLSGLVYGQGVLSGYTVAEIIAISDEVLGGCSSEFTPGQLRGALRNFNRNFDDGVNLGRYQLPGCDDSVTMSDLCGETGEVTVTFTAVDECGNHAASSATFTIEDTTNPDADITCPSDTTVYVDAACNVDVTPLALGVALTSSADICSAVTDTLYHTDMDSTSSCVGSYSFTRMWTYVATDGCGNDSTVTCEQSITVLDTIAPTLTLTCPVDYVADANATCDNDVTPTTTGMPTTVFADNCDGSPSDSLTYEDGTRTYSCDGATEGTFTFVRTWTLKVTDACGNMSQTTCDQNITIEDNSAPSMPVITCPADTTIHLDASCTADTTTANTGVATALSTDNCDTDVSYTIHYTDGAAVYSCDASGVCKDELYAEDFENETPENAANLCHDATPYVPADNNWSLGPACMILTNGIPQLIEDAGDTHLLFNNEYSADDEVFNSASIDISGLSAVRIAFDARSQGDVENSGPYIDQFEMFIVVDGTETSLYQANGHVDGTDGGGNNALVTYSYEDNVAVSGSTMSLRLKVKISGAGAQEQYGIDNLSICSVDEQAQGTYSFVRTWTATATDNCNNTSASSSCQQTIMVADTLAPVITHDDVFYIHCDEYNADSLYAVSAMDNCDSEVALTIESSTPVSGNCPGAFLRTYRAADDCGNVSTVQQTINLVDTVAPTLTLTCPNDTTLYLDASCYVDTTTSNVGMAMTTVDDNCDSAPFLSVVYSDSVTAGCGSEFSMIRTYTAVARDTCNNEVTLTCTQSITVEDTLSPTITCPNDTVVECDGAGNTADLQAFLNGAIAMDNCDSDVDITNDFSSLSDGCGETGSATVTFTATDDCGNSSSCTATFTIADTEAPSISVMAANDTVQCDGAGNVADVDGWLAVHGGAVASDDCSGFDWTNDYAGLSNGCGATGEATVTFTATDSCGLTSTTTATFVVIDTIAPTLLTMAEDTLTECDGSGNVAELQAWLDNHGGATASDVCGGTIWSHNYTEIDTVCGITGYAEVTFTVADSCGNTATTVATFTIEDTTDPEFEPSCPSSATVTTDALCAADTTVATHGTATFSNETDICDADLDMSISHADSVVYPCAGSMVVYRKWTLTATDDCSNSTTKACTQVITVNDETPPTIVCPNDTVVECDGFGNDSDITDWLLRVTAEDVCSVALVTNNFTGLSDGCGATGSATVWFYAIDACNNIDSCSATFTIEDNTKPALDVTGESAITVYQTMGCDLDTSYAALQGLTITAYDVCSDTAFVAVEYVDGASTPTCECDDEGIPCDASREGSYTFERSFMVTASDSCSNDSVVTFTQTITVLDTIAPQFTDVCNIDNGLIQDVCCESLDGRVDIPEPCEPTAMDNCDSEVSIAFTETYVGDYAPTTEVASFCTSGVPEAFEDGETCAGHDPHNLRLFGIPGLAEFYAASEAGEVQNRVDGTWVLNQTVTALDGSGGGWIIDVTYSAAMTWDEWQDYITPSGSSNTSYKLDCGNDLVDNHEDWKYRIMESGTLTGTGAYTGSSLSLTHSPMNHFYAFQEGESANNLNTNYGYSAWLRFSGTFDGNSVMGSGDIFGDLDCCLPWSINRSWTASDDCENSTQFDQTISINGGLCSTLGDDPTVTGDQIGDHTPVVLGGAGDLTTGKTPIRVTNLQPNPTNDWSLLGFSVSQNMRVRVDMYSMDGYLVQELYDGVASPNVNHTLGIEANELESGMYQIRLSSSQYLVVKKLLVTE